MDKKKSKREGKDSKKERTKLKKRKLVEKQNVLESPEIDQISSDNKFLKKDNSITSKVEKKKIKSLGRKKRKKKENDVVDEIDQLGSEDGGTEGTSHAAEPSQSEAKTKIENSAGLLEADVEANTRTHKSKKAGKKKRKDYLSSLKGSELMEKREAAAENEVYHISSGDEDCSKGMKKWITEYFQSRPGLKILQERIDEFITTHEEQEEEARKEREARAAEGGWTVVVHHKGRKKTTDAESGITVGSVAQAAVVDKMAKKKRKDIGVDFYRFQKREAQRNEIMMLQSKFEQDRKRIQQLRAARKFRPY